MIWLNALLSKLMSAGTFFRADVGFPSALWTFLLPRLTNGLFYFWLSSAFRTNFDHPFGICLYDRTLRMNAAQGIGGLAADWTDMLRNRGQNNHGFLAHDALEVEVVTTPLHPSGDVTSSLTSRANQY
jgi:hypothetical protein